MLHILATEGAGWVSTWTHPSVRSMVDTAFSLDHVISELALEIVTFALGVLVARPWRRLRKHDEKHTAEINALVDQRLIELGIAPRRLVDKRLADLGVPTPTEQTFGGWSGWTAEMAEEAAKYGSGPLIR